MTVWIHRGCHCCAGIEWGGEYPRECTDCDAWVSENDRTAAWPGGPFSGMQPGAFAAVADRVGVALIREGNWEGKWASPHSTEGKGARAT